MVEQSARDLIKMREQLIDIESRATISSQERETVKKRQGTWRRREEGEQDEGQPTQRTVPHCIRCHNRHPDQILHYGRAPHHQEGQELLHQETREELDIRVIYIDREHSKFHDGQLTCPICLGQPPLQI